MMYTACLVQKEVLKKCQQVNYGFQLGPVLTPEDILQHQETFLVVTTEEVLLASSGQKPWHLLGHLTMPAQVNPPQQRILWPTMPAMPRLRNPGLECFHLTSSSWYYGILMFKTRDYYSFFTLSKFEISVFSSHKKQAVLYIITLQHFVTFPSTLLNK